MEKEKKVVTTPTEVKTQQMKEPHLVHNFSDSSSGSVSSTVFLIILLVAAVLGLGTGYLVSSSQTVGTSGAPKSADNIKVEDLKKGDVFGSADEKTFKDSAEGTVREGGIEGEGEFHLERVGGESQHVYMTSSVIDLSQFVGKKVKVWGETNTAKRAGWLMDVGRLQLL